MKLFAAAFFGLLLFAVSLPSHAADKSASKTDVLQAIKVFQKDPSSKEGFAAADTIMAFVKSSQAVHVSITKKTAPWLTDKDASDADTRKILLTAYLAGDVESQLKTGRAGDDVYAGWSQVLLTYAQLLQINSAAKIAEVDELKKKANDGSLHEYAADVAKSGA